MIASPRSGPFLSPSRLRCFTGHLSLTPPSAWRKRQASRYHSVERSGHSFSFACKGLPTRCFMATTPKNRSKKSKVGRTASRVESVSQLKKTIATQEKTIASQERELRQALEQQTATSDILGIISSSPTDLQPVFDTIAKHSVKLCGALFSSVYRFDGELIHMVAHHNYPPLALERSLRLYPTRPGRHLFTARAILDRSVINVPDVANDSEHVAHSATAKQILSDNAEEARFRSVLSVPMLRGGDPIGAITVWHADLGPFSQTHVALLQTFAEQAVIAIENARLFQELQARNRDLTEALEQQTATSEVLRDIASSPTEIQPVLGTLIVNAVKLSGATMGHVRQFDGEFHRVVAHYGETPEMISAMRDNPISPGPGTPAGEALLEGKAVQVLDVQSDPRVLHLALARQIGTRTLLMVPLLREGTPIGSLTIWRDFVEAFTERQIELVKTFADQAVIAIENVRLFKELQERNAELREALEHQTATAE